MWIGITPPRPSRKYPDAKRYKDFRQMFDKEKSIDAVVVATPDHNHAIVSMTAIEAGQACLLREALDPHGV